LDTFKGRVLTSIEGIRIGGDSKSFGARISLEKEEGGQ
jgi:hypothetical protein